MSARRSRRTVLLLAAVAALATACAPQSDGGSAGTSNSPTASDTSSASADACAKDSLQTFAPGKLTLATDKPVYEPWFVNDKPENGKGFLCEGAPNCTASFCHCLFGEHCCGIIPFLALRPAIDKVRPLTKDRAGDKVLDRAGLEAV